MFRTVPLSILRSFSLYTQQWCMSYRFADSLRAGSGRNHFRPDTARNLSANLYDILQQNQTSSFLILPATCQKICMTYCTRTKPVPSWSCSQPVNKSVWHIATEPNHFRPDPARKLSANLYEILQQNQTTSFLNLLATCQQICMTYCSRTKPVPSWTCSQVVNKPVWHIQLLCVQWKTPDEGKRNCPKHVEFYSKDKFEKLVHLVGFIVRKICE